MKLEFSTIRHAANGHWAGILRALAPSLDEALDAASRAGRPRHVGCPVHGGNDGFRFFTDYEQTGGGICNSCGAYKNGFDVLEWVNQWSIKQAFEAVADHLGLESSDGPIEPPPPRTPAAPEIDAEQDKRRLHLLRSTWGQTLAADDPRAAPMLRYLVQRGLTLSGVPDVLRFHPKLPYYETNDDDRVVLRGEYPAMVAMAVTPDDQPATLHRTYLTEDGVKADVPKPKKLMSMPSDRELSGGSIPLGKPGTTLSVAEGIETALAVMLATSIPAWATISSTLMAKLVVPERIETLFIWSDLDRGHAGQNAAQELAERALSQGVDVHVFLPDGPIPIEAKSRDWLDVFNQEGHTGFPHRKLRHLAMAKKQTHQNSHVMPSHDRKAG
ncbi:MAG: toprim domain-containing protein [Salinisphaeraceae bacterium]